MTTKVLLVLASLIALSAAAHIKQCKDIKNSSCSQDSECKCAGATFICNRKSVCAKENFEDWIVRGKPCHRTVFKYSCGSDNDCLCDEGKLVCEDNECVQPRKRNLLI